MEEARLRKLAKDFLEPLIPGSRLQSQSAPGSTSLALAAMVDLCTIRFQADTADNYRLVLKRSQPFERENTGNVTEVHVVRAFVKVVKAMEKGLHAWYNADLWATFPRRVVAKSLCANKREEETVLSMIDQLSVWAGQQYEGRPITAAIGLVPEPVKRGYRRADTVLFKDICVESFSALISNGYDSLMTCNLRGHVIGHESLTTPSVFTPYAPLRLSIMADWAMNKRIALVLNRAGEILIFQNGQLRFAKRSGKWHFLTHAPVITQMERPDNKDVRKAVYSTCLDASFARTGACIGLVTSAHSHRWKSMAIAQDHLMPATSIKAKALSKMVKGQKFQDLDRRLRQELVAIDGATLIDHKGNVLAVGAIVKIPGGSTGGGRLAAAKILGALGLGIKVSQDGEICGFCDAITEPKFVVM